MHTQVMLGDPLEMQNPLCG